MFRAPTPIPRRPLNTTSPLMGFLTAMGTPPSPSINTITTTTLPEMKITPLPRTLYPTPTTYSASDFTRHDPSPDPLFYSSPRFVQHIDHAAISSLKAYYASVIKPHHHVLDVCSSWTSHLPDALKGNLGSCTGVGLNEAEMRQNEWLTAVLLRDLNAIHTSAEAAHLPQSSGPGTAHADAKLLLPEIESATLDVVICNLSIDYLVHPIAVLVEVRRCLKPGGTAHLAFSNRYFPTKVIGRWLGMGDAERRRWVGGYFFAVGGFVGVEECVLRDGRDGGDPLFVVRAKREG
jgi:SAM-dependent methyltransferase